MFGSCPNLRQNTLNRYLDEATERIIREDVFGDTGETSKRAV